MELQHYEFSISPGDQSYHAGEMAQTSAEDCLSLAIWTPINATSVTKFPVGFFIPGGSFRGGGLSAPYYNPAGWINRTQQHIMVMINYRVNIFGFPNAAGLKTQNLGILDQRLALEWVYKNIEDFGGDQNRITLWGHSAGALVSNSRNHFLLFTTFQRTRLSLGDKMLLKLSQITHRMAIPDSRRYSPLTS